MLNNFKKTKNFASEISIRIYSTNCSHKNIKVVSRVIVPYQKQKFYEISFKNESNKKENAVVENKCDEVKEETVLPQANETAENTDSPENKKDGEKDEKSEIETKSRKSMRRLRT